MTTETSLDSRGGGAMAWLRFAAVGVLCAGLLYPAVATLAASAGTRQKLRLRTDHAAAINAKVNAAINHAGGLGGNLFFGLMLARISHTHPGRRYPHCERSTAARFCSDAAHDDEPLVARTDFGHSLTATASVCGGARVSWRLPYSGSWGRLSVPRR